MDIMTTTTTATVKIGDVFYRSWGYDQTNVDYYEIVSVSPSGKTAKARQIKTIHAGDAGGYSDRVTAATGPDRFVEDPRCTRCDNRHPGKPGWDGHESSDTYTWQARTGRLTVTSYGDHAYPWDGQPKYQTAYGYGH